MCIRDREKAVDKAKIAISDYHQNYHKPENLKMTSVDLDVCLLYTSPSPRDRTRSRMPSSA